MCVIHWAANNPSIEKAQNAINSGEALAIYLQEPEELSSEEEIGRASSGRKEERKETEGGGNSGEQGGQETAKEV